MKNRQSNVEFGYQLRETTDNLGNSMNDFNSNL
jgi:hypothetical protein